MRKAKIYEQRFKDVLQLLNENTKIDLTLFLMIFYILLTRCVKALQKKIQIFTFDSFINVINLYCIVYLVHCCTFYSLQTDHKEL